MKETNEKRLSKQDLKVAKAIYSLVVLFIVTVFGISLYYIISNDNSTQDILQAGLLEQNFLVTQTDDNKDTDGDGYLDKNDKDPYNWNVGDRDLLMFATLAYEPVDMDVDDIAGSTKVIKVEKESGDIYTTVDKIGKIDYVCPDAIDNSSGKCMINEKHMIGMQPQKSNKIGSVVFKSWEEVGHDYYFAGTGKNGKTEFYASVDEVKDWAIVDHVAKNATKLSSKIGKFEATTFRYKNNIVIAYRGTDFPDLLEWFWDATYITNDMRGYEDLAEEYAKKIINKYTADYKNNKSNKEVWPAEPNFYITGHSLGGYLTPVGAVAVIKDEKCEGRKYLRDVVAFNGMGLDVNQINILTNSRSEDFDILRKWSEGKGFDKTKHKVVCYNTKGDLVSAMGRHVNQVSFYAAEGAIRRHMEDTSVMQTITRNALAKSVTSIVLKYADMFSYIRLPEVEGYFDYYNEQYDKIYGIGKDISILDLVWFCHEPSASLFYNISQGTRGNRESVNIRQNVTYNSGLKTRIELTAEVTGKVKSYQWYENNKKIAGATSSNYVVERTIGKNKVYENQYSVEVVLDSNENNKGKSKTLTTKCYLDSSGPKVTISASKWSVKKNKTIDIKITATDEKGFSDTAISASDIKFTGLVNNLKVSKVSNPAISSDGKTATWTVTVKGNIIGFAGIILNNGSIADVYGNYNSRTTSTKTVKVTL